MSDVNKSVSISLKANLSQLEQGLAKLPSMTEKEARAMVRGLSKELKKSEKAAKDAARANKKQLEAMRRQAKKTKDEFRQMGKNIGLSVAAAGVAVLAFTQQIADLSNELVDSSTKTGLSVETLQGLRLAAEGAGLTFGELEQGLLKLPKQMLKVQQGSKKQSEIFKRLGVDVVEYRDGLEQLRNADDVLNELFESLRNVSTQEEKAALAAELFGQQAGPKLIQSGALDNLESFVSLSKEFGISTGPEMRNAMADFQRVSAAAMETATGEVQRLLDTFTGAAEGGGMSAAVMLVTESFLFLSTVVQDTFEGIRATVAFSGSMISAGFMALAGNGEEAFKILKEEANKAAESTDNMFDTFERGTQRVNRFRSEVAKTLSAPTPTGGGGGDGDGETPEQKEQKIAQETAKAMSEIKKFSLQLEKDLKKATLDRLEGDEKLSEQIKQRVAEIEAEIKKNDEMTQSLINKKNALGEYMMTEEESSELSAQTTEREKQLRQEIADLSTKLLEEGLNAEIEAGLADLENDTKITDAKIENRKRLDAIDEKRRAQELAANQMLLSSISQSADAAFNIASESFAKNKGLILTLFNVKKAATLAEIAMSTAAAFQDAFSTYKVFAPVAQAAIIASGIAQAAVVASQSPPKLHMGGMVRANPDEQTRTLLTGEAVLDRATVRRIGEDGVNRLQSGGSSEPIVVVTNPYKHFDRFMRDRKRVGAERKSGRNGY